MAIRAVLFDFDGTIADTLPVCFRAFQTVYREYDRREVTVPEIVATFGPPEWAIIAKNLRNRDAVDRAIDRFYELYRSLHAEWVKPNEPVADMLGELKTRGCKLGLVTGKGRKTLDISLAMLGLETMFGAAVTGDDVARPKPDPEGVLTAMRRLGVIKEETVFVGDSDADIRAGKSAGVATVGAHWMETVQNRTFGVAPDLIATEPRQLLDYIADFR
jgi:HAD superfamily hydrolase (TIGR01509 family)